MAFPDEPLPTPYFQDYSVSGVPINAATLDDMVTAPLNAIAAALPYVVQTTLTIPMGANQFVATVPFGKTFTGAPVVTGFGASASVNVAANAYASTTTGCTVRVFRCDGTNAGAANGVAVTVVAYGS